MRVNCIGDQILGPKAFLNMREKMVFALDQIGTFAARRRRFSVTVRGQFPCRFAGRLLAGALKRIELIITDTGGFVA